jgi:hypothetical protein
MSEKVYRPKLRTDEVNGYWKVIGMTEEAWMRLSEAMRVQTAWADMVTKQKQAQEANQALQDSLKDD